MAIQPIDLSTVYSQMDNVAKFNASQNQMSHVANQLGIDKAARDNLEKSQAVKQTAEDNASATTVKQDGRRGSSKDNPEEGNREKKTEDTPEDVVAPRQMEISDPRLGQHIDITG